MFEILRTSAFKSQMAAALFVGTLYGFTLLMIARVLGPENFAVYGVAISAGAIILVTQDGGYKVTLFREKIRPSYDNGNADNLMSHAIGWSSSWTVFLLLGCLLSVFFFDWRYVLPLALVIAANLGKSWNGYVSSFLRARKDFSEEAKLQIFRATVIAGCISVAAYLAPTALNILFAALIGQTLALYYRSVSQKWQPLFANGPLWTIMLIDLLTVAYGRLDPLLLVMVWPSKADVGVYSALTRSIDMYVFLIAPAAAIFFRNIRAEGGRLPLREIGQLSCMLALPAILMLPLVWFMGGELLTFFLGAPYASANHYLTALVITLLFLPINFLLGQFLIAENQERNFVIILCCALLLRLGMTIALGAAYGPLGAVIATIIMEIFLLIAFLFCGLRVKNQDASADSRACRE